MDRRTFCLGSAAAAACWQADLAFAAGREPAMAIAMASDRILFDTRYDQCRSFAAAARRFGHEPVGFQGDVTALWYDDLRLHWAAGEGSIAGMTTSTSLFCLEQLAKDHWRRVVRRVEHGFSTALAGSGVLAKADLVSWIIAA